MLPQNTQNQTDITHQLANPFQLEVAKSLSKEMAVLQKNQLLTVDILNKVGDLSKLEADILAKLPMPRSERISLLKYSPWSPPSR